MQKGLPKNLSEAKKFMREKGKWFSRVSRSVSGISQLRTFTGMEKTAVHQELSSFVHEPEKIDALEIGPGLHPISEPFSFRSVTLLEPPMDKYNKRMLQNVLQTRYKFKSQNTKLLFGRVERHPLKQHFGVCILAEVLTHVLPQFRARSIRNLATLTDRFMILDRHDSKDTRANRDWLVDYRGLEAELEKMGFLTQIKLFEPNWTPDKYFLLKATKVTLNAP